MSAADFQGRYYAIRTFMQAAQQEIDRREAGPLAPDLSRVQRLAVALRRIWITCVARRRRLA